MASWRSGYAEDCKSLHPGSIPGEASSSKPGAKTPKQWKQSETATKVPGSISTLYPTSGISI